MTNAALCTWPTSRWRKCNSPPSSSFSLLPLVLCMQKKDQLFTTPLLFSCYWNPANVVPLSGAIVHWQWACLFCVTAEGPGQMLFSRVLHYTQWLISKNGMELKRYRYAYYWTFSNSCKVALSVSLAQNRVCLKVNKRTLIPTTVEQSTPKWKSQTST